IFKYLQKVDLKLNSNKYYFTQKELKFFEYIISAAGILTDPKKVKVVKSFPRPTTLK
ncbi:15827_t:CDS:1, partial [Gigaspora margarita]